MINFFRKTNYNFNIKRLCKFNTMCAKVKIGVIQLRATSNKIENFDTCRLLIEEASKAGVKMAFLPENFDFISENKNQAFEFRESIDGNLINSYRKLAKDNDIFLSLGGFHRFIDNNLDKIFNTHVIMDNKGEIKGIYDKLHLFDVNIPNSISLKESDVVNAGSAIVPPVETPLGLVAMSICYDVRFPELALAMREMSANILTYPSCFTVPTGRDHWHVLMKARALDAQCFVISAAQEGQHNSKRISYGHSLVVDPWGRIIAERTDSGPGLLLCDISLDLLDKVRSSIPLNKSRRIDLFPSSSLQIRPFEIGNDSLMFGKNVIEASCVFYKSILSYAFINISPLVPGHILVSPIRHIERFQELSSMEVVDIYAVVSAVAPKLCEHFGASSLTISQQDGPDAGQSVPHVHVHVLPRKPGDFDRNDDIYAKLRDHDKESNLERKYRTIQQMSEEATEFRKLFY